MKTKILLFASAILLMTLQAFSQSTWLKNEKGLYPYNLADKIGIGTTPLSEKLSIKSSSEIQLGIYAGTTQTLPFFRIYSNRLLPLFDIYASSGLWSFISRDTALAPMSVKGTRVIFPGILSAKHALQRSSQVIDSAKTTLTASTYLAIVNTGNTRADSISLANIPLYSEVTIVRQSGTQNVVVYAPSATVNGSGNVTISSSNAGKRFFKRSSTVIIAY